MPTQGQAAAEIWKDKEFATAWAEGDVVADLLALPRRIAAAVVEGDRPATELIVDVGSGPGAFLSVFLERFPQARGIWTDASEAMYEKAQTALAHHADRIDYQVLDMTEIGSGVLPDTIDVLLTSRAVHHLDKAALHAFYAAAAGLLAPGGWLVNLDHTGPGPAWDARLRAARKTIIPPRPKGGGHHHDGPLTSVGDHYAALDAAGFTDYDTPWRGFFTVLFMARKPD
jgi:SAM-dependent methyltransferase